MAVEAPEKQASRRDEGLMGEVTSGRPPIIRREIEDIVRVPTQWVGSISVAVNFLLLALLVHHKLSNFTVSMGSSQDTLKETIYSRLMIPMLAKTVRDPCSGHGDLQLEYDTVSGACLCHACFTGKDCSMPDNSCLIDLNQGDPKIFEKYWLENGDASTTVLLGWQRMSYYANSKQFFFVQTELDQAIRSVHKVVGNAVTEGRHIVIGTGSTQLFQAALYALSSSSASTPISVVSLAPYYSAYPAMTDYLKSSLYKWGGDAAELELKEEGEQVAYIELVTTPNNPTGEVRYPVVNGTGALVHDLAYYWPHYTPITSPADDDLMLFTVSKSTGHAGTRIGWAIVKELKVAQKMAKFIELNTIGVSKDAQIRAAQILRSVTREYTGCENGREHKPLAEVGTSRAPHLFHYGSSEMAYRWMRLRSALEGGSLFSLPDFRPAFCTFFGKMATPTPAFAWVQCNQEDDCEQFLKHHGILTRGGAYFGADARFVRLSMLDRRSSFEVLVDRLGALALKAAAGESCNTGRALN